MPILISSASRKEEVAKLQQVPVRSWLVTGVQWQSLIMVNWYCPKAKEMLKIRKRVKKAFFMSIIFYSFVSGTATDILCSLNPQSASLLK